VAIAVRFADGNEEFTGLQAAGIEGDAGEIRVGGTLQPVRCVGGNGVE